MEQLPTTYNDRYPPGMFESTTMDLVQRAPSLGLDKDTTHELNKERYIHNLKVLAKDGMKLSIMSDQTQEMVLTALDQNPESFAFVMEQTEAVCEFALTKDPTLIQYFNEQTPKQQLYAFMSKYSTVSLFREIDQDTLEFMISNTPICFKYLPEKYRTEENFKIYLDSNDWVDHDTEYDHPFTWVKLSDRSFELFKFAVERNYKYMKGISVDFIIKLAKKDREVVSFLNENTNYISSKKEDIVEFFKVGVINILNKHKIWNVGFDLIDELKSISDMKGFNLGKLDILSLFDSYRDFPCYVKDWDPIYADAASKKFFIWDADEVERKVFIKRIRKTRRDLMHKVKAGNIFQRGWWYFIDKVIVPLTN